MFFTNRDSFFCFLMIKYFPVNTLARISRMVLNIDNKYINFNCNTFTVALNMLLAAGLGYKVSSFDNYQVFLFKRHSW